MEPVRAILDACVLYPAPLRDLLVRLAQAGLFQARWTDMIHDEWTRGVLRDRPDLSRDRLEVTRQRMNDAVRDCLVVGYEGLVATLTLPDADDRHVLAAALFATAQFVVTFNLTDFPDDVLAAHNIRAIHPDDFVIRLASSRLDEILLVVQGQRAALKKPPKTAEEFVATLEQQGLPQTAALLRRFLDRI